MQLFAKYKLFKDLSKLLLKMAIMEGKIVNRVANSPLVTIDLEEYHHHGDRVEYDIAQNLFQGLILREKDLWTFVKQHDWAQYSGKNVNIILSADAIIPTWAFMLLVTKLEEHANMVIEVVQNC